MCSDLKYATAGDGAPALKVEAVGQSEAFMEFQEHLALAAPVERPILLLGERGTGKELAATRLHYLSNRWGAPLVSLNCAALSPALIESELFGYEKGAFTGAAARRSGRFEAADGGTLFLDEIGLIPLEVQEKILRVVEYGVFERVGSTESIEVDVRIVGATNADLLALTRDGRFKRDLLDRLSFEVLFLPPLRERLGDVMLLASHFSRRMAFELGQEQMPVFDAKVVSQLNAHPWPGNIRELKNVVERAVYRSGGRRIDRVEFEPFRSPFFTESSAPEPAVGAEAITSAESEVPSGPLKEAVRDLEIRMLRRALDEARYNQKKAAQLLGLSYDQFRGLKRKYSQNL